MLLKFIMYAKINKQTSVYVSKNLEKSQNKPFFCYFVCPTRKIASPQWKIKEKNKTPIVCALTNVSSLSSCMHICEILFHYLNLVYFMNQNTNWSTRYTLGNEIYGKQYT